MTEIIERSHSFHAEAKALHGDFLLPLRHTIEPQAFAALEPTGGYLSQHALPFRSEGIVSYKAAHTQVSGNRDEKPGHGWSTVSTAVIEGLNILEVITADRIVAQVFAEYPLDGYVPAISFLGTRFENLRIAGELLDLKFNHNILGPKPGDDLHYTRDFAFMDRAKAQCGHLCSFDALPEHTRTTYQRYTQGAAIDTEKDTETVECSLINQIEGNFPGTAFGHAMFIPQFGTIHFATVKLTHEGFQPGGERKTTVELTMVDAKLGCIGQGSISSGSTIANGKSHP